MAFAATPELAAAVTTAGGLGAIGAGFDTTSLLKEKIAIVRRHLKIEPGTTVPVVIGFIGWILDMTEVSDDPRLVAILDELPAAVWLAFGTGLEKYLKQVRVHDIKTSRNTFVFVLVHSVESARRAAGVGADALVVQGIEAGGHGRGDAPPLLSLLQAVLCDVEPGPMILAAGGISTGAQVAALLTMGADGVVLGTRFLFTHECEYTPAKKEILVGAGLGATVRTLAFDEVGRTNGWPPNYDGRAVSNNVIEDLKAGLSIEERIAKFDESALTGDNSRLVIWAGIGVGLTEEIKGAADVLRELHEETVDHMKRTARLLV
ncbi:2-nitropropane dioxygenase [Mycena belliarum]|uniref:2-nitropropane dioxygenase n=1 Tax=Mycena belliarum TaxID=1033014 RepID=A0AAD6XWI7_9AGAR|nr:2-nitropropane dioxygenase [Mycena belliae]